MIIEINKEYKYNTNRFIEQLQFNDIWYSLPCYVFVYGTLKRGHGNNKLLSNAEFIGKAETVDKLHMTTNGAFPYVSKTKQTTTIKGELYKVTHLNTLTSLDRLEGFHPIFAGQNRNHYHREKVKINVNGNIKEAWIYLSNTGVNLQQIPTGYFA